MSIEEQILNYLIHDCERLGDEYGARTVMLRPDSEIAAALGLVPSVVTRTLYELADREKIIAEGSANYGPIVTIYEFEEMPS